MSDFKKNQAIEFAKQFMDNTPEANECVVLSNGHVFPTSAIRSAREVAKKHGLTYFYVHRSDKVETEDNKNEQEQERLAKVQANEEAINSAFAIAGSEPTSAKVKAFEKAMSELELTEEQQATVTGYATELRSEITE